MSLYRALTVHADSSGSISRELQMLGTESLPANDLLIKVEYSVLNYLDALALDGQLKPAHYPFVPGIDAAGIVVSSNTQAFSPGDEVIVTGFDMGMKVHGGMGGYISVPAGWAIHVPMGLDMRSSMAYGSAGIAAGIGVFDLKNTGVLPGKHKVAVTGASCGAGAVATAIMAAYGYEVSAFVSNPKELESYVTRLGACSVESMDKFTTSRDKRLMPAEYDGAFDTMGGETLNAVLKYMNRNSTVVFAGSNKYDEIYISPAPFLNRAVNMLGVNTIGASVEMKAKVWQMIASEWKIPQIDWLCTEISLSEVEAYLPMVLSKEIKGQLIINHSI